MLTRKYKEGVIEVRRQLVEAASKDKLPIKMSMGKKQNSSRGTNYTFCFLLKKTQIHLKYKTKESHWSEKIENLKENCWSVSEYN